MRITSILLVFFTLTVFSCTNSTTTETVDQPVERTIFRPVTLADSIAYAHGFDHWQDVQQIDFRFDVDIDGEGKLQREWSWFPKSDSVIRTLEGVSTSIIRNTSLDSTQLKVDGQFINDSYWLLMPFYLVWNKGSYTTFTHHGSKSPLSDEPRTLLTIQYNDEGGYTPGDAYDLFVDSDYKLREWIFRKKGQMAEVMIMDWSEYRTIENLLLPANHNGEAGLRIHHPVVRVVTAK